MSASVARHADPFTEEMPRLSRAGRVGLPWIRRQVLARLGQLSSGRLRLHDKSGLAKGSDELVFGEGGTHGERSGLEARVAIHDRRLFSQLAFGGSIGAAEAYMAGYWSCDQLTDLIRLLVRNRPVLENMEGGWAILSRLLQRLVHARRANTRIGSRRNIEAHYDLGNDFYKLFLDREAMMYSCALFERADMSLEEASLAKLDRLCRKLELSAEDRVLEIGTGWGGFAIHAATRYGCRVTTTTISPAQLRHARERVAAAGLGDRVAVIDHDYRELEGRFDKVVAIEMIEAVGLANLETFFERAGHLLRSDGRMALQSIIIADRLFASYRRSVDFIQRYIFPGGALPSIGALTAAIARASDLRIVHLEEIGPHYAKTLHLWRKRFSEHLDEVRRQGFSESFIRMWDYYFAYCEGAFLERAIGNVQIVLTKPEARPVPILGKL